ncbi:MAG: tryptophan--tRNA ligase [Phycisphaerae bacterium]|nr:tryptophan--tRNA ligase [Phycisphaerae bacterium]
MTRASIASHAPSPASGQRPRVLTGDTPTGRLHLGHYVGSIERRLELQVAYDCYFLLANMHAFTTRAEKPDDIRSDTIEIVKDWLACGIDPARATVVLQTEVPAIAELSWFFAMLIPFNRVMNNPTIKTEIESKGLGDSYPFGFPLYSVGQCADILAFRPVFIPVGEDQVPHIEMCRFVAGKFNQVYCNVNNRTKDEDHEKEGGIFPIPQALIGRVARLPGIDGKQKMSKSLGNAVLLSDPPSEVKKKIGKIFTGRQSPTEPGDPNNALMQFVDAFIRDPARAAEIKDRYARGDNIGDGHVKAELTDSINALLEPIRARRAEYEKPGGDDQVIDIIKAGTRRANVIAEETLWMAKEKMRLGFFRRTLS